MERGQISNHGVFYPAALVIVKEVANHANDIMKQGVSAKENFRSSLNLLVKVFMRMPPFLNLFLGHLPEAVPCSVQADWPPRDSAA